MNITAQLEFELTYFKVTVQHLSHYTMDTPSLRSSLDTQVIPHTFHSSPNTTLFFSYSFATPHGHYIITFCWLVANLVFIKMNPNFFLRIKSLSKLGIEYWKDDQYLIISSEMIATTLPPVHYAYFVHFVTQLHILV